MRKFASLGSNRSSSGYLLRVDRSGRPLGVEDEERCHRGAGIRHSAFLVMLFDEESRLLQARRSRAKKLWPDYWDGTVASHFKPGEDPEAGVRRRVFEELGLTCNSLDFLFKFPYQSRYKDIGVEKEVCHIYRAQNVSRKAISLNRDEVSDLRISGVKELAADLQRAGENFTPWFLLAFKRLFNGAP